MDGSHPDTPVVLLIDDDQDDAVITARLINKKGITVKTVLTRPVEEASEALDAAMRTLPRLVILSLKMPDAVSWKFVRRLKDDPRTAQVPIVLLAISATRLEEWAEQSIPTDAVLASPPGFHDYAAMLRELVHNWLAPPLGTNGSDPKDSTGTVQTQ